MGAEGENDAVMSAMRNALSGVAGHGFGNVEVATLREDWPQQRVQEEARIRGFVESESAAGRRVLVIPYRLNGFGPYATVLEGTSYAAGEAFVPHASITDWIAETAAHVACAQGWSQPFGSCAADR
jgi:sirohydrochlorin cobaltochelatase